MVVAPASEGDATAIVALRDAAAHWQQERGIRQWSPGEVRAEQVREQVRAGQWHVVRDDAVGGLRAALRVLDADLDVWGRREDAALYVHGLVVDRALAGRGVGAALLRWVEDRARSCGARWVRLDCAASNARLRGYYVGRGFTAVGGRSFDDGWEPVVLLERAVRTG